VPKEILGTLGALEQLVYRMRGRRLPPERELARQFGVSRPRIRTILEKLETRGLVVRRQGSGTYAVEEGSTAVADVALLVDARLKLRDDPFFSAVVEHVQHVCQAEGIRCTLERLSPGEKPVILEDAIVAVGLAGREVLERLGRGDVPAVGLFVRARPFHGARVTLLDLDDRAGGCSAAEHLLSGGCEQLFFVGRRELPASAGRLAGVMDAAAKVGRSVTVIESGMNYVAGWTARHWASWRATTGWHWACTMV